MNKRQREKESMKHLSQIPKKVRNKIRREAKRKTSGSVILTGRTWDDDNSDPLKDLMNAYSEVTDDERHNYYLKEK